MKNSSAWWKAAVLSLLTAAVLPAVDTHVWEQSDQADFARGTRKGISIRSDGRLTLAPEVKELDSTGVPYLWALAEDSKGTVYYAGGAPTGASTKVFALTPGGKPKLYAEVPGLEVHALAIDRQDRVYAAVLPDAKIYRLASGAKPELFFDPKCKYIWAMQFDKAGNLFAATGDNGIVYKISPNGEGIKFFDTQETHARSLTIDDEGNLIVGTEPGGLIMRITPQGQSFVLYQAGKREVTAVAVHNGTIYAAAIGNRASAAAVSGPAPVLPSAGSAPVGGAGTPKPITLPPALAPPSATLNAAVSGGSELYRIDKDGFAQKIWSSPSDLIYAIGFNGAGTPLIGTGNKGIIYRIDSDHAATELLDAPPTQITAFAHGRGGVIYAVTGNVGNLYSIGPGLEQKGTLESDVLDANEFAYWGKVHLKAAGGASIAVETRSGNVNAPQKSWSPWSAVKMSDQGGPVNSPAARFLQYRLTLSRISGSENSPELSAIDIPYLPKNAAPRVERVDVAPFNYRQPASSSPLERSVAASGSPLTISLPAVGRRSTTSLLSLDSAGAATLQYSKGFMTLRWSASDANGDPLEFKVELRRQGTTNWVVLKDKLPDRFYAFDTTAFADGVYTARISASDAPANTPANELSASLESDTFTIDNTPPEITGVSVVKNGSQPTVKFTAQDALSWIDKAEYSRNGSDWTLLEPDNRVSDSQTLHFTVTGQAGETLSVRVFDDDDNSVVKQLPLE